MSCAAIVLFSTAVVCVVLLYVCVGWLTYHASGLPRGFHSVAGAVYCSLSEFVHTLPFFSSIDLPFAGGLMKLCLLSHGLFLHFCLYDIRLVSPVACQLST